VDTFVLKLKGKQVETHNNSTRVQTLLTVMNKRIETVNLAKGRAEALTFKPSFDQTHARCEYTTKKTLQWAANSY
jgi:hypothetical protein